MSKSIIIVVFMFFILACENRKQVISSQEYKEIYTIVCKHPMGHTLRFSLDKHNWYYSNNIRIGC